MGISGSKSRRKKSSKQFIIVNSNATDDKTDFNCNKSDELKPPDIEDRTGKAPTLKWHRANPKEEIVKIQQEAEIRDIETIYENSRIREKDLLNLMPDHYWSGMENKLPRYVMYRGNYPEGNGDRPTNLRRIKSSSLSDLTESTTLYFNTEEDSRNYNQKTQHLHRSISCPHINTASQSSLSKLEKDVPIKGILKNRKIHRPNSAMIVDSRDTKSSSSKLGIVQLITVAESEHGNQIVVNGSTDADDSLELCKIRNQPKKIVYKQIQSACSSNGEGDVFCGYFDQSPSRVPDGSLLRVNVDKKVWIKNNLDKRLNLRPSSMDLANRNILHEQDEFDRQSDFEQTRCLLSEKLSERPTLTELKKQRIIKFSDFVEIQETDNYDRSVARTWGRLTEIDKESIRNELNEFKDKEMKIHLRSKKFTKFHDSHNE